MLALRKIFKHKNVFLQYCLPLSRNAKATPNLYKALYPSHSLFSLHSPSFKQFSTSENTNSNILEDVIAKFNQSSVALHQGDFTTAVNHLEEAIGYFGDPVQISMFTEEQLTLLLQTHFALGNIFSQSYNFEEAMKEYKAALDIANRASLTEIPEIADVYNALGGISFKQGKAEEALEFVEKASAIYNKNEGLKGKADPNVIQNLYYKSIIYGLLNRKDEALEIMKGIIKEIEQESVNYEGEPEASLLYIALGTQYRSKKDPIKAQEYSNKGINKAIERYGPDSEQVAYYYRTLTEELFEFGDYEEAIKWSEKHLNSLGTILKEKNPRTAAALLTNGIINCHLGNLDKSLESCEKAAEKLVNEPEYFESYAHAYTTMCEVYLRKGQEAKAFESIKKAIEVMGKNLGESNTKVIDHYILWAELLRGKLRSSKETVSYLKKGEDALVKAPNKNEFQLLRLRYELGLALYLDGNMEETLNYLEKCTEMGNRLCPNDNMLFEDIYNYKGLAYIKSGKFKEGAEMMNKAIANSSQNENNMVTLDDYYRSLAIAYNFSNEPQQAESAITKAIELATKTYGGSSEKAKYHQQTQKLMLEDRLNLAELEKITEPLRENN